jgi:hypothetical protein
MITLFDDTVHRGTLDFDDFDFDSALESLSSLCSPSRRYCIYLMNDSYDVSDHGYQDCWLGG